MFKNIHYFFTKDIFLFFQLSVHHSAQCCTFRKVV